MTVNASGTNYLTRVTGSSTTADTRTEKKEDVLGRDSFLTMLVAQLENQDPLNPMDGTDFSAQLAQFSQLEQLMNLNDTMVELKSAFDESRDGDIMDYVGRQVSVRLEEMDVLAGAVSGGSFSLDEAADVMITITDADGNFVRNLYYGGQDKGTHVINWDGKDSGGNLVADGTYAYTVMANSGYGFEEIPSTLTGTVDAVIYDNGRPYLIVDGISVSADQLVALYNNDTAETAPSVADYLGKTVKSPSPVVLVKNGAVSGSDLAFDLSAAQDAVVQIYDQNDELVRSLVFQAGDTQSGTNLASWDGTDNSGSPVSDGLYYYTLETASQVIRPSVAGLVSAVTVVDGKQYLVMNDSGRLVSPGNVTAIN